MRRRGILRRTLMHFRHQGGDALGFGTAMGGADPGPERSERRGGTLEFRESQPTIGRQRRRRWAFAHGMRLMGRSLPAAAPGDHRYPASPRRKMHRNSPVHTCAERPCRCRPTRPHLRSFRAGRRPSLPPRNQRCGKEGPVTAWRRAAPLAVDMRPPGARPRDAATARDGRRECRHPRRPVPCGTDIPHSGRDALPGGDPVGDLLLREAPGVAVAGAVDDEGQGGDRPGRGFDDDPASRIASAAHLPAPDRHQGRGRIRSPQAKHDSAADAAPVEGKDEARPFAAPAKPPLQQAKAPVIASHRADAPLGHGEFRLPDQ